MNDLTLICSSEKQIPPRAAAPSQACLACLPPGRRQTGNTNAPPPRPLFPRLQPAGTTGGQAGIKRAVLHLPAPTTPTLTPLSMPAYTSNHIQERLRRGVVRSGAGLREPDKVRAGAQRRSGMDPGAAGRCSYSRDGMRPAPARNLGWAGSTPLQVGGAAGPHEPPLRPSDSGGPPRAGRRVKRVAPREFPVPCGRGTRHL